METFSALLALCEGNSSVYGEFPSQKPVTRSFDVSLVWAWTNGWVNNRDAGDLRRHRAHYDVIVLDGRNEGIPDCIAASEEGTGCSGACGICRKISNIKRTKSQNLNVSCIVLKLSWPNLLKPGVKWWMKMYLELRRQPMLQLHLSDQQFNCLLRCYLYWRFDGTYAFVFSYTSHLWWTKRRIHVYPLGLFVNR